MDHDTLPFAQRRAVSPTPLDRYVPAAALIAAVSTLLIIFFGRW